MFIRNYDFDSHLSFEVFDKIFFKNYSPKSANPPPKASSKASLNDTSNEKDHSQPKSRD